MRCKGVRDLTCRLDLSEMNTCCCNFFVCLRDRSIVVKKVVLCSLFVKASLTSVSLLANKFDDETVAMLLKLWEDKPTLTTLCGLKPDQIEADNRRRSSFWLQKYNVSCMKCHSTRYHLRCWVLYYATYPIVRCVAHGEIPSTLIF